MKRLVFLSIILFSLQAKAQYYQTGTESTNTQWRIISKKGINLIFPADAETFASTYLNSLLAADTILGKASISSKKPFSVVLHNHSVVANGFVSWAPSRMELITFPLDVDNVTMWHNNLAIHETSHVKQMQSLGQNFFKAASYLLGEQSVGFAAAMVPQWYLEGEAVYNETKFTKSGRGRNASFYQHYRTKILSTGKNYKFDKLLNGSYRDYVPNQYALGYQFVSYANHRFGVYTWNKVIDFVSKWPITVGPFYFGVKKFTKHSPRRLSDATFVHNDSLWRANFDSTAVDGIQISANNRSYSNYLYPYQTVNNEIICYKTSLKRTPEFVKIDSLKDEQTLIKSGSLISRPYINDSLIIWSEYKANIRWEQVSYGRIIKFNYRTGKRTVYSNKAQYFAPVYSAKTKSIIVLSRTPEGFTTIQQISKNGNPQVIYTFNPNCYPQEMAVDGDLLYVSVVTNTGKQVVQINSEGKAKTILKNSTAEIKGIHVSRGNLYFSATDGFVENLFCYNVLQNKTYRVINSKYGTCNVSVTTNNQLVYSNYTNGGYCINRSELLPNNFVEYEKIEASVPALIQNETQQISTSETEEISYKSEKYSKIRHLINLHSWAPLFIKPIDLAEGNIEADFGATVMSQNLTGTTVMTLGYGYKKSAPYNHLFNATVQYSGLWPKISASFDLLPQNAYLYAVENSGYYPAEQRKEFRFNVSIPLYLSTGNVVTYALLFTNFVYANSYLYSESVGGYRSGNFKFDNGFYFSLLTRTAHRDLFPRLGTTLRFNYVTSPASSQNIGSMMSIISRVYLPGIAANHSILIKSSYQKQNLEKFYYPNIIEFPRGYTDHISEEFFGIESNYALPLCYPDFNIGMLLYIKRLSLNLFFDYAQNYYITSYNRQLNFITEELHSYGFELSADYHFLRLRFPIQLTFQLAWPQNSKPVSSFGLNFSIN